MLSPLYGQLSPLRVPTRSRRNIVSDTDAEAYLQAVESADTSGLEQSVADAVNSFIVGCKSDGIWSAIKSSCILAGARTLSGALVPLVGTAPTNANFVSGDYNRKTGLLGNGTSKYLNAQRAINADPQNSQHYGVYVTEAPSFEVTRAFIGNAGATGVNNYITATSALLSLSSRNSSINSSNQGNTTGYKGVSRSASNAWTSRTGGSTTSNTGASSVPNSTAIGVFARGAASSGNPTNARFSFYSIGENLSLALLDTRIANLMTAIAAALP